MDKNKADQQEQDMKLRTPDDLSAAQEWLFNKQRRGQIDSRSADALNTTLKGAQHLRVDVPIKVLQLMVQAHKAKMTLPIENVAGWLKLAEPKA